MMASGRSVAGAGPSDASFWMRTYMFETMVRPAMDWLPNRRKRLSSAPPLKTMSPSQTSVPLKLKAPCVWSIRAGGTRLNVPPLNMTSLSRGVVLLRLKPPRVVSTPVALMV